MQHPSYLGAYVAIVGSSIFLNSTIGIAFAAIATGIAYSIRISVEETTLENEFGDAYRVYKKKTPAIVSFSKYLGILGDSMTSKELSYHDNIRSLSECCGEAFTELRQP